MQDRAIYVIGQWRLADAKISNPVDLYIENMFPGQDYQMLILEFEISLEENVLRCNYKGIDIENVSAETSDFIKYAYRKGSSKGGDVTFTTKLGGFSDKKINSILKIFDKITSFKEGDKREIEIFKIVKESFEKNKENIVKDLQEYYSKIDKKTAQKTGITLKFIINGNEKYLYDFETIKKYIPEIVDEKYYTHSGTVSKAERKISSVSGKQTEKVYGFASPGKYSTADKEGFISGFFNKKKNWRNYPISPAEALVLDLGLKYIMQNLRGYFYGNEYWTIPNPIISTDKNSLKKIINLLKTAFDEENKISKERKKRAEDRILKIIGEQENYFSLDLIFFEENKTTKAITINLVLEEILPSRFRRLFIDVPEKINKLSIFKNAIYTKKEGFSNLTFSFSIVKTFFDKNFLDVVNKIFVGRKLSYQFVFEHIMRVIRKNYNDAKTSIGYVENLGLTIKKALMLMIYLQELNILNYNQNYKFMERDVTKTDTRFDTEKFYSYVKENPNFFDEDVKVGIFAVGVLVRFLFDIQQRNLQNTPFENKLHGFKINPELLKNIYIEALDKIEKYQGFYIYSDLRDIISKYFTLNSADLTRFSNNEISFYFVAGLELGREFKKEKEEKNEK